MRHERGPHAKSDVCISRNREAKSLPATSGADKSTTTGTSPGASAAAHSAPAVKDAALGTAVFSADGKRVGEVKAVKSAASGTMQEIQISTGGLDGSNARIVVVPAAKIAKSGKTIEIAMTSEEIGKQPATSGHKG
jgi:hypothetical protein